MQATAALVKLDESGKSLRFLPTVLHALTTFTGDRDINPAAVWESFTTVMQLWDQLQLPRLKKLDFIGQVLVTLQVDYFTTRKGASITEGTIGDVHV